MRSDGRGNGLEGGAQRHWGRRLYALWAISGREAVYVGSASGTSVSDACLRLAIASPWFAKDFDAAAGTWRGHVVSEGHYENGAV